MKPMLRPIFGICILTLIATNGCTSMLTESPPSGRRPVVASYLEGDLITTYSASLNQTLKAATEALSAHQSPQIDVLEVQTEEKGGKIDARTRSGIPVTVRLEATDAGATRVRIRVGIGDQATSMSIQEEIGDRLPILHNS